MKRKVVCIFVLVFWALMVCTILSAGIEQQMTAQVTTITMSDLSDMRKLPLDALFYDEDGMHLYEVVKGSGWESGNRVQEIAPELYWIEEDGIVVTNGSEYGYIQYASKPIASGDLVQIVHQYAGQEGSYLIVGASGTGADMAGTEAGIAGMEAGIAETGVSAKLWKDVSVAEQNEKALLLSMAGQQPYMEAQVRSALAIPEGNTIYSLGDVRAFFGNIPLIAVLLALMIVSVTIWGYSCILSRKLKENKLLVAGNLVIGAILLEIFHRVTQAVQFPSSLLPGQNILELEYYRSEFSEISGILKDFSNIAAKETMEVFQRNMMLAGGIILFGMVVCAVLLLLERRAVKDF